MTSNGLALHTILFKLSLNKFAQYTPSLYFSGNRVVEWGKIYQL